MKLSSQVNAWSVLANSHREPLCSLHQNLLEGLLQPKVGPTPAFPMQWACAETEEFAFLTSSQVRLMLLAKLQPHFNYEALW